MDEHPTVLNPTWRGSRSFFHVVEIDGGDEVESDREGIEVSFNLSIQPDDFVV
jgi:hypothetical protein